MRQKEKGENIEDKGEKVRNPVSIVDQAIDRLLNMIRLLGYYSVLRTIIIPITTGARGGERKTKGSLQAPLDPVTIEI